MQIRECKVCKEEKDIKKFAQYKTKKGTILRKSTCNSCYNNKYNPWEKKPFNLNKFDNRFKWKFATHEQKLHHINLIFNSHVIRKEGSWDWQGAIHHTGYAVLKLNKKQLGAHRVSWMISQDLTEIPDNLWILHHCDNKKCTNPNHLYLGTPSENSIDREKRCRRPKLIGTNHPNAILNEEKVIEIKIMLKQGISIAKIANKFECGLGTIEAIKRNYTWKHVKLEE